MVSQYIACICMSICIVQYKLNAKILNVDLMHVCDRDTRMFTQHAHKPFAVCRSNLDSSSLRLGFGFWASRVEKLKVTARLGIHSGPLFTAISDAAQNQARNSWGFKIFKP